MEKLKNILWFNEIGIKDVPSVPEGYFRKSQESGYSYAGAELFGNYWDGK